MTEGTASGKSSESAAPIFERNRASLLFMMGKPEKPTVDDVDLLSLDAIDDQGNITSVVGHDKNIFGRLAVQHALDMRTASRPQVMNMNATTQIFLARLFAENWEDRYTAAGGKGRPMLIALGTAIRLENMVWR